MVRRPQLGAEALRNPGGRRPQIGRYRQAGASWDESVRHTDPGRFDSGRLLRNVRSGARGCARVGRRSRTRHPTRTPHLRSSRGCGPIAAAPPGRDGGSRHPMRARARCALKARRASSDAYTTADRCCSSRAFVSKSDRRLFPSCRVTCSPVRVRTTHGHVEMVARRHAFLRLRARVVHDVVSEGAVRNLPAFGPAPFPQ